jgi:hypothetical protein
MKEVWVEFIGSGYEVVHMIKVEAAKPEEAFEKAEAWYKQFGNFHYCDLEIKDGKYIEW